MDTKGIIVVDTGTTSIRAILFEATGRIAASCQVDNPPVYHKDGRVEQNPDTWTEALFSMLSELSARAASAGLGVAGLSLTAQRSSVIPVDGSGAALHPAIMWQDKRTETLCESLSEHEAFVYMKSGLPVSPVFSAAKMTWLKRNRPEVFARTHRMLGIQDYLVHALTGAFVTDRSLASRTNLFNLDTGDWDEELLRLFELDRGLLCELVDPGEKAGALSAEAAATTGLGQGLPVISAGGDQQCAALGLGLLSTSDIVANTGTGSYVIGLAEEPIHDPLMRLFCNVAAIRGKFIIEAALPAGGAVYRWFADRFFGAASAGEGRFEAVNAEVASSPPGANGVILLPHFKGAGAPHWNPAATGLFFGLGLSTTRGDMARAVLEGVAAEMAENLAVIEEISGRKESLRLSGGLARFPEFARIQADFFGRQVLKAHVSEVTALGAWISAAVRLGLHGSLEEAYAAATAGAEEEVIVPDLSKRAVYLAAAERRKRLYAALEAAGLY